MLKIGIGYDAHRLIEGRALFLGGVKIEYPRGLLGHSDGDVLSHAIADALLGAAGLGDLGHFFPDTDPAFKGARSTRFLVEVRELLRKRGWTVVNVDATVVAQEPKLAPYRAEMAATLARALGVDPEAVSVKASTTEGMGFEGRGEGMSACAVAMIESSSHRKGQT